MERYTPVPHAPVPYTPMKVQPEGRDVAPVHAQIRRDMGLLPEPLTLHAPCPDLLCAAWAALRETVLVEHRLPRRTKEAMAVALSQANRCPYCVDAHAVGLHAAGDPATEAALRRGRRDRLDGRTRALVDWAEASRRRDRNAAAVPPFAPEETAEAVGTALCFHYINRMVTILLQERLLPFRRGWLRGSLLYYVGRRISGKSRRSPPPGESLAFLPPAPRPAHLAWASGVPEIAAAFAALAAATEAAGAAILGGAALRVRERLGAWTGEEPPLGGGWLDEPLAGLPERERSAGRLALLAALAPHRAHGGEVEAFRRRWPGEAPLVGTLAWASFEAARRVSEWLALPG